MANKLKKYARYDGSRQLIPSGIVERAKKPSGKFQEVIDPADGCCTTPPSLPFNYKGIFSTVNNGYYVPTYYLSDLYNPPSGIGQMVLPVHFVGLASTYIGRVGTVPSQPQGPVQMYFSTVDANNIDWNGSFLEFALYSDAAEITFTQNDVAVTYVTNTSVGFPFATGPGAFYFDTVFGTSDPASLVLKYPNMNNVAFNFTDPITITVKL